MLPSNFDDLHTALEAAQLCDNQLLVSNKLNHPIFLLKLSSVLNEYSSKGISLEIADLANEIGLMLGQATTDKKSLIQEFNYGFSHGVDLAEKTL